MKKLFPILGNNIICLCCACFLWTFYGCSSKPGISPIFEVLDDHATGLDFNNKLVPTADFNMFKYMYFYNGSGIGAGDFNRDGLIDLFFSSNQGQSKIYLNEGEFKFRDVTEQAKIPTEIGWSTGVSVVDINNDGLLDIYVCRVGNFDVLKSKNQLLVCQGIDRNGVPFYKDEAALYGLDFSGFSTQAVFFDYDMDGDLDMFLLNHTVHQSGNYAPREKFINTYNPLSGDRLFRNDGGTKFIDVTRASAINSSEISYGLGICVSDIDLDGWPDIYVGNDFHENDYLYINQHNGSFKDELTSRIMHTSQFTMGVDVADINNDAYPDIVSLDMLPADPYILKRSLGGDEYDIFNMKISYGYNTQYSRNNLQLNRRNGKFSEVGLYAGIAATDWSWAALWMDFDNDGLKDLFISNGIPRRLNDLDYLNYISSDEIQKMILENKMGEKDMTLMNKFPEIKLPNKFFRNAGDLRFEDMKDQISGDRSTFSNGSVYADLDNDGDLDIVVSNIDDPVLVYQNKTNDKKDKASLELQLSGPPKNINAIGAKIIVYGNGETRVYEKYPVHGFQSSLETPVHIGLDKTKIDSILLVWPDNTYQPILWNAPRISIKYKEGLPGFDYQQLTKRWLHHAKPLQDITGETDIQFKHEENHFNEFDREPLIPHMVSTEGPALAVADVNHDGLDDVFIGSSRDKKSAVFFQQRSGKFIKSLQPAIDNDSAYEDVAACWADVNNDGNTDLIVASGGNEFYGEDEHNTPRVYLNDGDGNLKKLNNAFDKLFLTASCVLPQDVNGDGFTDLFIGGRAVPNEYGRIPKSYVLINDRTGRFRDETMNYSKELSTVGFVTNAFWFDIDKDGDKDLLVSLEWGGIVAFIKDRNKFTKKLLTDETGWWNFVLPCDVDKDGNVDLICGNLGLNSRLIASQNEPVRLYYNDFDGNGRKEQVLTYYMDGKEIPFASKPELEKQLPELKKRYLYAKDFAAASLQDLFSTTKLDAAEKLSANYFANTILMNKGNLQFVAKAMPWEAQLAPYKEGVVVNANGDSLPDILLFGNYYDNNIAMGRYDADYGTLLINKGHGQFSAESFNGLSVSGQVRHVQPVNIRGQQAYILALNNDSLRLVKFN